MWFPTSRHLPTTPFYSFLFKCIRTFRMGKRCHDLSAGHSHQQKEKKTTIPGKQGLKVLFQHELAAARSKQKMKHRMPFSPLTNTAAQVCSDLFQASALVGGRSQLCVGVAGMIQQRNMHGWKHSNRKQKILWTPRWPGGRNLPFCPHKVVLL